MTQELAGTVALRHGAQPVEPLDPWPFIDTAPASGEVIAELVGGGERDAIRALDVAAAALEGWAETTGATRSQALLTVAASLMEETTAEELAVLVATETGKRVAEARAEVQMSAAFFQWFATATRTGRRETWTAVPGVRHEVTQRPLGVVAALTPWNFPLSIPARKLAAALAAGCTVVFKPSEVAPLSALRLAEVVESHVPPGVVCTVIGEPRVVVGAWLEDPRLRGLSFTGSTRVGRQLAAGCAEGMVRPVFELGGAAPFVVLDDADTELALELLAVAKYRNNGQSCIAANHAWVPHRLLDAYVDGFVAASERLVLGDPLDPATTLGPLALATDPKRIARLMIDAEEAGATVLRCSPRLPARGQFAPPAICLEPPEGSAVFDEELFGPALVISGYRELDEVLAAVRASRRGLGGYVVGHDAKAAAAVARQLDVGIVGVNNATPNTPQVPFGGLKLSGHGYEGGRAGLDAFLTYQAVAAPSG